MSGGQSDFQVRFWKIDVYKGKRKTSYRVRWSVGGQPHGESFATRKLAESFRSSLMHATREGEAFDRETGLPRSAAESERRQRLWVELSREFMDAKWEDFSPRHRKSTVEGLVTLTCGLVRDGRRPPDARILREALTHWEFNPAARSRAQEAPDEYFEALHWIGGNSLPLTEVGTADGVRAALKALGTKLDGTRASAATIARKRAALSGALSYAVERQYLPHSPLRDIRVRRQLTAGAVDPRVVVNPDQARLLLEAVREI